MLVFDNEWHIGKSSKNSEKSGLRHDLELAIISL